MTSSTYPVRVDAVLDPHLNRGLWLIKWAMVIPHYVVLMFLWAAFAVLSVVAFFGILVTGRYPRGIFEFNVGVLRWSWRVAYFAYGALGTDKYPPFSLQERPDYPAHLEVEYPEHLSRGLVLVKWWLLAIPHYLVVGVFLGGGVYVATSVADSDATRWGSSGGLIGLLVLIAAVVLLFTGRYPKGIFDVVLGMNRWVLRVAAYAALMTDTYPPFRLDMGPDDPGSGRLAVQPPPGPAAAPSDPSAPAAPGAPAGPVAPRSWTTGRVVAVSLGSFLLMLSGGMLAGGLALVALDNGREAGFVTSGEESFSTGGYAVTTENLEFHVGQGAEWVPESLLGDTRLTVRGDDAVFVGVAATADVDRYLADVSHATLAGYDGAALPFFDRDPVYRDHAGSSGPTVLPDQLDIWVAQAAGAGERSLTWTPEDGDWTVVLMNADGTPGVAASVSAGAELPFLDWAIPLVLSVGGTLLVVSVILVAGAVMTGREEELAS